MELWTKATRIACHINWAKKEEEDKLGCKITMLCPSSCYHDFVLRMLCASCYFYLENKLGDSKVIDRFVMLQGKSTPRVSVIRRADVSDFCIDSSVVIPPRITVVYSTCLYSTKLNLIREIRTSANVVQAWQHGCKTLIPNMLKNGCQTADRVKTRFTARPAQRRLIYAK